MDKLTAIIPARGGSKGVPRKNIRLLNGKPLIQYTIEAALNAECIDHVVVTTDDEEIAAVAKQSGAEVPFLRPPYLAGDHSSAVDVYLHAAGYIMEKENRSMDKFMVLLPTCPFRRAFHIDEAMTFFSEKRAETLISVVKSEPPVSWLLRMDDKEFVSNAMFDADSASGNRQENKEYYVPNGAIYILDHNLLKTKRSYYSDKTVGYVMSRSDSVDIDTMDDFRYAEWLMGNPAKTL